MQDIIDQPEFDKTENQKTVTGVLLAALLGIILLLLHENLRTYLPVSLTTQNAAGFEITSLLLILILLTISVLITNQLNKRTPALPIYQIVVITGFILFAVEWVFKLIQNIILMNNGFDLNYGQILRLALIVGFWGLMISNIRIHKLRKKKVLIPVLLLIAGHYLIGIILGV